MIYVRMIHMAPVGCKVLHLDKKLDSDLEELAKKTGRTKSDLIRAALRRGLVVTHVGELRRSVAPYAEARGWLTDEDVFRGNS